MPTSAHMTKKYSERVGDRRYRGILTEGDASYIENPQNSGRGERDTRYRFRERLKNAIEDLRFLLESIPRRQFLWLGNKLYKDLENPKSTIEGAIAFLYLIHHGEEHPVEESLEIENTIPKLGYRIEEMVYRSLVYMELAKGKRPDVSVNISINSTEPPIEEVIERLFEGDGTTMDYHYLSRNGSLDPLYRKVVEADEPLHIPAESSNGNAATINPTDAKKFLENQGNQ